MKTAMRNLNDFTLQLSSIEEIISFHQDCVCVLGDDFNVNFSNVDCREPAGQHIAFNFSCFITFLLLFQIVNTLLFCTFMALT